MNSKEVIFLVIISFVSAKHKNNGTFSDSFLIGVSTSSYQIEGAWNEDGKGENIWDRFVHDNASRTKNDTGDVAGDSYHKYKEDVALAASLGITHYRFSIAWTRILPTGFEDEANENGITYYRNLVDEILSYNMIPMPTMYHWDLPQALQDVGGWTNPRLVDFFVKYARVLLTNFEDVGYWVTINEPRSICTYGYGNGIYAPGILGNGTEEYMCASVIVKAHAAVYHMYKREFPHHRAKMGITIDGEWCEPASNSTADVVASERRQQFEFGLYAHPILKENWPQIVIDRVDERSSKENLTNSRLPKFTFEEIKYIKGTFDFLGFNIYSTHYVADAAEGDYDYPSYLTDIRAKLILDPSWRIGFGGNSIVPWGVRKYLQWVKKNYNNPEIFITETGVADDGTSLDDYIRIDFFTDYLSAIHDAIYIDGVRVFGFTAWSLIDNFEWADGYSRHFGLYHINNTDPNKTRTPKKSVTFFRKFARTRQLPYASKVPRIEKIFRIVASTSS